MTEVLDVRKLSCYLKKEGQRLSLVKDVSFSLSSEKTFALVGESGSGKSTTALSLLRLLPQFSSFTIDGSIVFQGQDLVTLSEKSMRPIRGGKIAMIFQDPAAALNPVFPIGQQVAEMWQVHTQGSLEEAKEQAIKMLEKVGLQKIQNYFETYPHELSGGMKQRVMIAMALICKPKILIADEPTTALDATVQKEILVLLKSLQKETGMALFIITHDMGVVAEMADQVAVMYAAEIVEQGSVESVFKRPLHPYTQALFAARPHRGIRKKPLTVISGVPPQAGIRPQGCPFHPRCPFAMEKCKSGSVTTFYDAYDPTHFAKCWLLEGEGEEVQDNG